MYIHVYISITYIYIFIHISTSNWNCAAKSFIFSETPKFLQVILGVLCLARRLKPRPRAGPAPKLGRGAEVGIAKTAPAGTGRSGDWICWPMSSLLCPFDQCQEHLIFMWGYAEYRWVIKRGKWLSEVKCFDSTSCNTRYTALNQERFWTLKWALL